MGEHDEDSVPKGTDAIPDILKSGMAEEGNDGRECRVEQRDGFENDVLERVGNGLQPKPDIFEHRDDCVWKSFEN